jgi:alpha/beta superfamily hydrolase
MNARSRRCASISAAWAAAAAHSIKASARPQTPLPWPHSAAARWPGRALIVAGFSFGGYVALRLARHHPTQKLIAIAPAVQFFEPGMGAPNCPWVIIQGDADDVVDPNAVIGWASALTPAPRVVVLSGVGHFFHGRLRELRDAVIDAIRNG